MLKDVSRLGAQEGQLVGGSMWAVVVPILVIQVVGVGAGAAAVHQVHVLPGTVAGPTFGVAAQQLAVVVLPVLGGTGVQAQAGAVPVRAHPPHGAAPQLQLEGQGEAIHQAHIEVVRMAPEAGLELGVDVRLAAPVPASAAGLALAPALAYAAAVAMRVAPHLRPKAKACQPSIGREIMRSPRLNLDIRAVVIAAAVGNPNGLGMASIDDAHMRAPSGTFLLSKV
mmetsp:Transcript_135839/g.321959  ORF Transcript_135839/g.321959 Transcript_135839/m.321959 type:complete len:225 (-) Transcript_135839:194-868(-)